MIKKKSGASKFVSVFGKSTIPHDSHSYRVTREVTRFLIENGYGIIHGGYAGGLMQAVADEAYSTLGEYNLPYERNIAVHQAQHDAIGWPRVPHAIFTKSAKDVYARLRIMVTNSEFMIFAPRGGDGTMLELMTTWHENVIAVTAGGRVVPIIILEAEDGTDWKQILSNLVARPDSSYGSLEDVSWLYVTTSSDLPSLLKTLTS